MSDKHLSVFPKVLFYVFDVGSDWTNGAFMIQEVGSSFNISCLGDHEQEEIDKFFGYMTIGMSWFPAISGMTMLISFRKTSFAWKNLCSDVLRFIFWPLLVPIYM